MGKLKPENPICDGKNPWFPVKIFPLTTPLIEGNSQPETTTDPRLAVAEHHLLRLGAIAARTSKFVGQRGQRGQRGEYGFQVVKMRIFHIASSKISMDHKKKMENIINTWS